MTLKKQILLIYNIFDFEDFKSLQGVVNNLQAESRNGVTRRHDKGGKSWSFLRPWRIALLKMYMKKDTEFLIGMLVASEQPKFNKRNMPQERRILLQQ